LPSGHAPRHGGAMPGRHVLGYTPKSPPTALQRGCGHEVGLGDGERDRVALPDGVRVALADALPEGERVGVTLGLGVPLGVGLGDGATTTAGHDIFTPLPPPLASYPSFQQSHSWSGISLPDLQRRSESAYASAPGAPPPHV
jgi:hypothetical protein